MRQLQRREVRNDGIDPNEMKIIPFTAAGFYVKVVNVKVVNVAAASYSTA
jgi:hypothetical protein